MPIIGKCVIAGLFLTINAATINISASENWPAPFNSPQVKRQDIFEFTDKPAVKYIGNDKYEISFAVTGFCDVTVALVNKNGKVVRHLTSGVLGSNAPAPFQKNSKSQKIIWDGKDDLEEYVKQPNQLRVRVSLGLKTKYDKVLAWHPYDAATWDVANIYRAYRCIDIDESGVYVQGGRSPHIRKYDHDGKYVKTVFPPHSSVPLKEMNGINTVEFKPGKKSVQGGTNGAGAAHIFHPNIGLAQHARVKNGRFIYASGGNADGMQFHRIDLKKGVYVDKNRIWANPTKSAAKDMTKFKYLGYTKLATSPDGRYIYVTGLFSQWYKSASVGVYRLDTKGIDTKALFIGHKTEAKKGEYRFTRPEGLDVDALGRIYVCDFHSHVIRVYSPEGKHLKAIDTRYPYLVRVHQKTGGIYAYSAKSKREKGGGFFLTRIKSFDDPRVLGEQYITTVQQNYINGTSVFARHNNELMMALDSWAPVPRVWVQNNPCNIQVFNEKDGKFTKHLDFYEETRKAGLTPHMMNGGSWHGVGVRRIFADRSSEKVLLDGYGNYSVLFDLKTGGNKVMKLKSGAFFTDRGYDAKGFLYSHLLRCVTRCDPRDGYREIPFDYGTVAEKGTQAKEAPGHMGVIATKTQGVYGNRDGFGVNARGDMAVCSNIAYVPKFENDKSIGRFAGDNGKSHNNPYDEFKSKLAAQLKRGDLIYHVKRWPGRYLAGGTIWTYDWSGELRNEDTVPGLGLVSGVQIDIAGNLYIGFEKAKMVNGKAFLDGKGINGITGESFTPRTGTLFKCPQTGTQVISTDAQIKMDPWPKETQNVSGGWLQKAHWLYGGHGPADSSAKSGLDWYQRSFVPENYRNGIGVIDTNGNLITHIGRYGNADEKDAAFTHVYYADATDGYICVGDFGSERIVVLKIEYQRQEFVPIQTN